MVGMSIPSAHSSRAAGLNAHGLPLRSMLWNAGWSCSGKRLSMSTRLRRIPLITSRWSMLTGHSCTQARQLVQAQSSSSVM
jgi:hypothetical protein